MNDKSGLSRTLYDNKGNLIVSTSNNDKDIVRYEYDSNDRITKIIYPTNATVTYNYYQSQLNGLLSKGEFAIKYEK